MNTCNFLTSCPERSNSRVTEDVFSCIFTPSCSSLYGWSMRKLMSSNMSSLHRWRLNFELVQEQRRDSLPPERDSMWRDHHNQIKAQRWDENLYLSSLQRIVLSISTKLFDLKIQNEQCCSLRSTYYMNFIWMKGFVFQEQSGPAQSCTQQCIHEAILVYGWSVLQRPTPLLC